MFKVSELNISDYIGYAAAHVGETHELGFQSDSKYGEVAGTYTILDFEVSENPHFTYHYWKHEEQQTPDSAELGYYWVKLEGTKFYNGKTIKVPVTAYVQSDYEAGGRVPCYKTKSLFIHPTNAETNKRLKAYAFGILDHRVKA